MYNEIVQSLQNFKHHYGSNRLEHCISVAYYSYKVCKFLNLDYIENIEVSFSKKDSSVIAWGPSSNFEDNEDRPQYEIARGDFEKCSAQFE